MSASFAQSRLLWTPIRPADTSIEAFRRAINRQHPGLNLRNYHDLHAYSVDNYEFWKDLWQYLGVVYSVPPEQIVVEGTLPEVPSWFPGARLNYAENILRRTDDAIACTVTGESGSITHVTFRKLREMVADMAAAMRVSGLVSGDRVAAIATNSINAIVIMLASASIGCIFTSTAPDMGAKGILDRYRQIQPKLLFIEMEVMYAGRTINLASKATEIIQDLTNHGLQFAVLLPSAVTGKTISLEHATSLTLSKFLSRGDGRPLVFEQLPFNHELVILYSSGTTGTPKCIVHSAGGILLQTMKDIGFFFGVGQNDTLLQYTTTGWMMWNLMIAGLAWGARLVLYDGSPFHPSASDFLRLVNDQGVSVLGVSPRFLAEIHDQGIQPLTLARFEGLRTIASGGAVLTAPLHEWAQNAFGSKTRVMTAAGGTDICSAFVSSVLSEPVYAGEIACKGLGMKIEVYDQSGKNIEHSGEAGEMVCSRPHPSIPYFWDDKGGEKFHSTYYVTFPGVWRQGDLMAVNPATGGMMMLGRSDGVLNRSGIRFGSGEIYSVMERFSARIEDSFCVGQRRPQDVDERILLFVKMRPGQRFSKALVKEIEHSIRNGMSSRHVPDFIFEIEDIPYTVNGKKIEVAVKKIVSGQKVKPSGAVGNPDAFRWYYPYARLEERARGKL
ncbi:Acetoacetyl-CoA synthetase [Hypsizygus marmoreus]|uniref:Acetoacetyl-CoA synthetase n=1 Tax=Hypsizygus marmoreus TaxID=39966 RepID=A0A369JSU6_HYPMA|nr:Acetoacetyl-CoA synthetase [Hypsizygus marmoreus]